MADFQLGGRVRPEFVPPAANGSGVIQITNGRHPCMSTSDFIPNDIHLGGDAPHCVLVTGPNMGGKSTTLRLTCAIVVMAQIGCLVPAEACKLTPVDQIFTRIGANDNIMAGAYACITIKEQHTHTSRKTDRVKKNSKTAQRQ